MLPTQIKKNKKGSRDAAVTVIARQNMQAEQYTSHRSQTAATQNENTRGDLDPRAKRNPECGRDATKVPKKNKQT